MPGLVPPSTPPYAYVVDYRPLDACSPPACAIAARKVAGFADTVQWDGDPGGYVRWGEGKDNELFYRRGVLLRPNEAFEFTLPESGAPSELDAYVAAGSDGATYHLRVDVDALDAAKGATPLATTELDGITARATTATEATLGNLSRYARHVRLPLPSRARRVLRVRIRNLDHTKAAIGSPVVMKRVEGRGPRQALFAVFDAVPFHLFDAAFRGRTGEEKTAWLGRMVSERGVYFPQGRSPAQSTMSFVARFLGGEAWGNQGWPGMFGLGAIDESLPPRASGPVSRAAEQGMLTEFVGNNFLVLPDYSHLGFDGGLQTEVKSHAAGLDRYVAAWAANHPRDDAFLLVWNTQTHLPYPPGRLGPKAPAPEGLDPNKWQEGVDNDVWRNLLEGLDHLEGEIASLRGAAPDAQRVVWIGADHSRGVTTKMLQRAFRSLNGAMGVGLSHGCGDSVEESSTPFALIFDGAAERPPVSVVDQPVTSYAAWRALEARFGMSLALPETSMFFDPVFSKDKLATAWDDRLFVSVGLVGAIRATRGDLAYGVFAPKLSGLKPIWQMVPSQQLLVLGTPDRVGSVVSEELHDDARDPFELDNVASTRFDDLVAMRREVVDYVAAHYDAPKHPRRVYTLVLPRVMDVRVRAPRAFTAVVNGVPVPSGDPTTATVHASVVELVETSGPIGVVELLPIDEGEPMVLTCASSGLPLDALGPERQRLDLALGATNCPVAARRREGGKPGVILFSARPATADDGVVAHVVAGAPVGKSAGSNELLTGMKKWGYVRDIDKKGKP